MVSSSNLVQDISLQGYYMGSNPIEIIMSRKHSSGKGDTYRKVDYKTYAKNYDKIFKKPKSKSKKVV